MFLKKKQKEMLSILYQLCSDPYNSTAGLSHLLNISKRKVKENIQQINEFLSLLNYPKSAISINNKGVISYADFEFFKSYAIFYDLKEYLHNENANYTIISEIFNNKNISFYDLSRKMFFSESHIRNLIRSLNAYLSNFDFIIKENNNFDLDFVGDEISIRIFLFTLFSHTIQVKNSLTLENTQKNNDFAHLIRVIENRFNSDCSLKTTSINNLLFINHLKYDSNFIYQQKKMFTNSNVLDNENELNYFIVFFFLFSPNKISEKCKISLGKSIIQNSTDINCLNIQKFIEKLISHLKEYTVSYTNQCLLAYDLMLLSLYLNVCKDKVELYYDLLYPKPSYKVPVTSNTYQDINNFLETFIIENPANKYTQFIISSLFAKKHILMSLYNRTEFSISPKINVHINLTIDIFSNDFIKEQLSAFYNLNMISFCSTLEDADIIITDHLTLKRYSNKIVYLDRTADKVAWKKLFTKINILILDIINYY